MCPVIKHKNNLTYVIKVKGRFSAAYLLIIFNFKSAKRKMKYYFQKIVLEAGLDEAGRGCLAGPVFAAAVIWPAHVRLPGVNDSKQLTPADRERLRLIIVKKAISWSVASTAVELIDRINILQASMQAMHQAVQLLTPPPELLLIDGHYFVPLKGYQHQCIISGDALYTSIAAASILAKTYRDDYMLNLHQQFPQYGWDHNKGYATADHRAAIDLYGPTPHHRMSFRPFAVDPQLKLFDD